MSADLIQETMDVRAGYDLRRRRVKGLEDHSKERRTIRTPVTIRAAFDASTPFRVDWSQGPFMLKYVAFGE